jgi:hypothetical protein
MPQHQLTFVLLFTALEVISTLVIQIQEQMLESFMSSSERIENSLLQQVLLMQSTAHKLFRSEARFVVVMEVDLQTLALLKD